MILPDDKPYIDSIGKPYSWADVQLIRHSVVGGVDIRVDSPLDFNQSLTANRQEERTVSTVVTPDTTTPLKNAYSKITDASATKPYTVKLPPDIYKEQPWLKGWVASKGDGYQTTSVQPAAAITANTTLNNTTIEFYDMEIIAGAADMFNLTATGITINFVNCRLKANSAADTYVYQKASSAGRTINFINCYFEPNGAKIIKIFDNADPGSITDSVYVIGCYFGAGCGLGTAGTGMILKKVGCYSSDTAFTNDENVDKLDGYDAADIIALDPDPAATVTNEQTYAISPAVGTSALYARGDHTHGSPPSTVYGDLQGDLSEQVYLKVDTALISQTSSDTDYGLRSTADLEKFCQSFTMPAGIFTNLRVTSISLRLSKTGAPAAGTKMYLEVYAADANDQPTGSVLGTSASLYVDEIDASAAVYKFAFGRDSGLQLTAAAKYCVVLTGDWSIDASNYIAVSVSTANPYANGKAHRWNGAAWVEQTGNDYYFIIGVGYSGYNIKLDAIDKGAGYLANYNLAPITQASKVSGASLYSLASIPTGAGLIPQKQGAIGVDVSAWSGNALVRTAGGPPPTVSTIGPTAQDQVAISTAGGDIEFAALGQARTSDLKTSNTPQFTGLLISAASTPSITITDTDDNNSLIISRTDASALGKITNKVNQPANVNYSVYVDGVNDYVSVPDATPLRLTSAGTIRCWIKRASGGDAYQVILSKGSLSAPDDTYGIWLKNGTGGGYTDGDIVVCCDNGTGGQHVKIGNIGIADYTNWHCIQGMWSGAGGGFIWGWVDGTNSSDILQSKQPTGATSAIVSIGSDESLVYDFKGYIDEVQIHNNAKNDADAQAFYNSGAGEYGQAETGLVLGLHMDVAASPETDYSSNGYTATGVGNTLYQQTGAFSYTGTDVTRTMISLEDGGAAGEGGILRIGDVTYYDNSTYMYGNIKKIGQSTHTTNYALLYDGTKFVNNTLLPVAGGGTGASTAANARTNLGVGTGDSPVFAGATIGSLAGLIIGTAGVLSAITYTAWTTWTPTTAGITVGSGTITARYAQIGKTVFFYFRFVLAADSDVTDSVTFSLPVTASASLYDGYRLGLARLQDTGTMNHSGLIIYRTATSLAQFRYVHTNGTQIYDDALSSTAPFDFGNTDTLECQGFYEAA